MSYDPDGDPAAFDPSNLEQLQAWVSHANTKATAEDLGREFRSRPPAAQIAALGVALNEATKRRDDVMALLAEASIATDDPRRALALQLENEVGAIAMRIRQLVEQVLDEAFGSHRRK